MAQNQLASHTQQRVVQSKPTSMSHGDLMRLRPAVLGDLKSAVAFASNKDAPEDSEVERQFKLCKFTQLNLGALGAAVLVEWNPQGAANAQMLNVYVLRDGAYERLFASDGFGPIVLAGGRPVPDLVFGWTEGVCHANYYRYRFQDGRYVIDACNRETQGKNGDCAIAECESKLQTFPEPNANQ
jgi:hypothetical protein